MATRPARKKAPLSISITFHQNITPDHQSSDPAEQEIHRRIVAATKPRYNSYETEIDLAKLQEEDFKYLENIFSNDKKTLRLIETARSFLTGSVDVIPSFNYAQPAISAFLSSNTIDRWIYRKVDHDTFLPYLITDIRAVTSSRSENKPTLTIYIAAFGTPRNKEDCKPIAIQETIVFEPSEIARKTPAKILASRGFLHETPELKKKYLELLENYYDIAENFFAKEFLFTGQPTNIIKTRYDSDGRPSFTSAWNENAENYDNHRCIGDIEQSDLHDPEDVRYLDTSIEEDGNTTGEVPFHPYLRLFALGTHRYIFTLPQTLTRYTYRPELADNLILPKAHQRILSILTSQSKLMTQDIVFNKKSGNMILLIGSPGTGKTLTAEIYSEIIKRPLYRINTNEIGITSTTIESRLQHIMSLSARWDAILLLDEADVFVASRSEFDINRNAIVAQFLRVTEYYDPLFFVTTNLDNIDDAFKMRGAAIIRYAPPTDRDIIKKSWNLFIKFFEMNIEDEEVETLIDTFPNIAPRDIKMLTRLVAQAIRAEKQKPTVATFIEMANFRDIKTAQ